MKNYQVLLTFLISMFIAWSVLYGHAQEVVHFQDELNEIFVFILSSTMGIMSLFALNWKALFQWLRSE